MTKRKIFVTGLGAVSAAGLGVDALWHHTTAQKSVINDLFDVVSVSSEPVRVPVGVVPWETQPIENIFDYRTVVSMDRAYLLGRIALEEAMADAGLVAHQWPDPSRVAIIVGSELAGISSLEAHISHIRAAGFPRLMRPRLAMMTNSGPAGYYAEALGVMGPSFVVSAACASSGYAVGLAQLMLESDQVDVVLVGGVEAPVTDTILDIMLKLGALDPLGAADPASACRPFDASRSGTVIAEGAGFLVLQSGHRPLTAEPKAALAGFGGSSDAHHRTAPHPSGRGTIAALTTALKAADIDHVDHVNAHATATILNDKIESHALATVVPSGTVISATKGAIGHSLAASGALENVIAVRSIVEQMVPGVTNLKVVGDDIGPIRLQRQTDTHPIRAAASVSIGFAGYNTASVFAAA